MARRAQQNPRQVRVKSCGCPACTKKFRPGEKSTRKSCTGSWQARYRDPAGKQKARNWPTEKEALAFLDRTRTEVRSGSFVDPARAQLTLTDWYTKWRAAKRGGETTLERSDGVWRNHVEPHFGGWPISVIGYLDVEAWVLGLTKVTGVPTITKAFQLLDQLLTAAVLDRRVPHNPCDGVKLPKRKARHPDDLLPPTYDQLAQVRELIPAHYHPMLIVAEETGLRWGELVGLRRCNIDFKERIISVREVVVEVDHRMKRKEYPKSAAGMRVVPLTDRAARALKEHLERHPAVSTRTAAASGMHAKELVFRGPKAGRKTKQGTLESVLTRHNFQRLWLPAIKEAGIARQVKDPVTKRTTWWPHVHDIRHAFASRLHALGVPEADAQAILGHERGGKVTWLYTHASDDAAGRVRGLLNGESDGGVRGLRVVS